MRILLALAAAGLAANAVVAQATWHLRLGDGLARIVGASGVMRIHAPRPSPSLLPAGACTVHFGFDALGKPMSLQLDPPDGAVVAVAVVPAPVTKVRSVALDAPEWRVFAGGVAPLKWNASCVDVAGSGDYRVEARFAGRLADGSAGVVARWTDERQHYRFVWDRARTELRLERQHGDLSLVLAHAEAPAVDESEHTLALQVEGFRLAAFLDDALVLQAMDGAFATGASGLWWAGAEASWAGFAVAPPAASRGSSAIVSTAGSAVFHAATMAVPGNYRVLELRLDRAHPPLPCDAAGLEPWLLTEPAAPRVLLADWRDSLGAGCLGEVPVSGAFASRLQWPSNGALAGQSVLVRAALVAADGGAIEGWTPAVPLRL